MREQLRSIFETAKSSNTLRVGIPLALTAAFLIGSAVKSQTQPENFEQVLEYLPQSATAYNPSENERTLQQPHYKIDYNRSIARFRASCTGMPQNIREKKDVENWVYTNFANVDFASTPLNFRDSIYNLTVTFDASESKDILLTNLNRSLPNSRLLTEYLDRKRVELAVRLQRDPEIQEAARNWNTINDDAYKQRILQRVSRITLQTLLPNKTIDYPRVFWDRREPEEGGLRYNTYAVYGYQDELISLNGKIAPMNYNFQFASDITIHESVHHFQTVLVGWGMRGYFSNIPDLDRYVSVLNTISENRAGAVRTDIERPETFVRYRLLKSESMSWGFGLVGSSIMDPHVTRSLRNSLERNMYTYFEIQEPLNNRHHRDMLHGAPIPTMPQNTNAGTLPSVCNYRN